MTLARYSYAFTDGMCDIYNFTDNFTVNDFVSLSVVGIKNLRVI